jgi:ADP-heptose:LPS heptosyltransferase
LHSNRLLLLEVAALVGADRLRLGREIEITERDRLEAARAMPDASPRPLVLIHPGAGDLRRHWPPERFAAVADALFEAGASIAVNGTADEARFARAVIGHMQHPATDMSDRLSLPGLCGLLERCTLVVSNDSGPLHLALAIGTPCVGIYWLTNLYDGAPLQQDRHRAAMALRVHCPVCGAENRTQRCPHDVSFVDDIAVDEVLGLAMELFRDPRCATR